MKRNNCTNNTLENDEQIIIIYREIFHLSFIEEGYKFKRML